MWGPEIAKDKKNEKNKATARGSSSDDRHGLVAHRREIQQPANVVAKREQEQASVEDVVVARGCSGILERVAMEACV